MRGGAPIGKKGLAVGRCAYQLPSHPIWRQAVSVLWEPARNGCGCGAATARGLARRCTSVVMGGPSLCEKTESPVMVPTIVPSCHLSIISSARMARKVPRRRSAESLSYTRNPPSSSLISAITCPLTRSAANLKMHYCVSGRGWTSDRLDIFQIAHNLISSSRRGLQLHQSGQITTCRAAPPT